MNKPLPATLLFATTLLTLISPLLFAQNTDREQPVNIEADRMTVDDRNKIQTFEGRVILTQGSLVIKGDKLVVTQGADGFQTGVATAIAPRLATFRQKQAESNEMIDGEAKRIEYDSRTERAKLFELAKVKKTSGDEVRGNYIEYDAITENYRVNSQPDRGKEQDATGSGRVHAVIQPKGSSAQK